MTGERPLCVACKQRHLSTWTGRNGMPPPKTLRPARYLVYKGLSQVERFECAECQAETGNRIAVDLDSLLVPATL